jgi:hypothetical protein
MRIFDDHQQHSGATMKLMNRTFFGLAVAFGFTVGASAQSYSIDWFSVAGGGGTSTGGVFSICGTVGQPEVGATMSGGPYTVDGGFWSLVPVAPSPGAPKLSIRRSGADVLIAWPAASTGFVLQQNSAPGNTNWTDVANAPVVVGNEKQVIVTPSAGSTFYRLKSQ